MTIDDPKNLPDTNPHHLNPALQDPEYTIHPQGDTVPGLSIYQNVQPSSFINVEAMNLVRPFANARDNIIARIDARVQDADDRLQAAIDALGDGYDQGEIIALIDAQTSKWSAQISQNAADIAELTSTVIDDAVVAVTAGMNEVATGVSAAAGSFVDATTKAFNRLIHTLTGKNLGYWDAEIYVASGAVFPGYGDTPLGIYKAFNGRITDITIRCLSVVTVDEDITPQLSLHLRVNRIDQETITLTGNETTKTVSNLRIDINAGDIIGFYVGTVTGSYSSLSISINGVYL